MKPYGMAEHCGNEFVDCIDVNVFALPSRYGKTKSANKRSTRRYFKRKARQEGKDACKYSE